MNFTIITYRPADISCTDIDCCSASDFKFLCSKHEEEIAQFISECLINLKDIDSYEVYKFVFLVDGRDVLTEEETVIYEKIIKQAYILVEEKLAMRLQLKRFQEEQQVRKAKLLQEENEKQQLIELRKKYPNV